MFIGEYETQLGEKNRIAIPKKLREEFEGEIFITRGYEECLILVDKARWEKLMEVINRSPLLSLSVRDTKRFILGGAAKIEADSQGRFVLPEELKKFSKLENKIVFIGVGEWIEIWSFERWQDKLNVLKNNVSDLAEKLG